MIKLWLHKSAGLTWHSRRNLSVSEPLSKQLQVLGHLCLLEPGFHVWLATDIWKVLGELPHSGDVMSLKACWSKATPRHDTAKWCCHCAVGGHPAKHTGEQIAVTELCSSEGTEELSGLNTRCRLRRQQRVQCCCVQQDRRKGVQVAKGLCPQVKLDHVLPDMCCTSGRRVLRQRRPIMTVADLSQVRDKP